MGPPLDDPSRPPLPRGFVTRSALRLGAWTGGVIFWFGLLGLHIAASVPLPGEAEQQNGAVVQAVLAMVAGILGGAVGAYVARRNRATPAQARAAAVLGPVIFSLIGVALLLTSGTAPALFSQVLTIAGAVVGGWLGSLLVLRGLRT